MKTQDQLLLDRMRQMIRLSCRVQDHSENPYYSFQKSLLRHFFDAADVSIDYQNNQIILYTKESPKTVAPTLYRLENVVAITISYNNLEETLKGCLDTDRSSLRLYASLLFYYSNISVRTNNVLSA